jgi:hypothetical protein
MSILEIISCLIIAWCVAYPLRKDRPRTFT